MMAMQLMSEWLLQDKIAELQNKSNLTSQDKMLLSLCQKEIEVIKKLKLFGIDMTGSCQEVIERLENQEIQFFNRKEYDLMCEKSRKYDLISKITNTKLE